MALQACGTLPERPPGGSAHPPDVSEVCPPWCAVQHDQDEPLDLQAHESDTTPFPVIEIERRRGPDETPTSTLAYDVHRPKHNLANHDKALTFVMTRFGLTRTSRTYKSTLESLCRI